MLCPIQRPQVTTDGTYFVADSVSDIYHGTFQRTGAAPSVAPGSWHTLRLNVTAANLTGWLDGTQLFSVAPGSTRGAVGVGVQGLRHDLGPQKRRKRPTSHFV